MAQIETWTVDQVVAALVGEIGLPEDSSVLTACRENAIDGAFLMQLTPEEMKEELGMTGLQVKKVKRMIEEKKERTNGQTATTMAVGTPEQPGTATYGIPAPLNVQPPPAGGAYAGATNPYMTQAPAGYPSGPVPGGYPMGQQQQQVYGGGGLQPPPASYGVGMPGSPPPLYYAPPNYQQQQYPQTSATNQGCCRLM